MGIFLCTEIQLLDQFPLYFHIFMAAASHHFTCFQFPVIKIYKKTPKILFFAVFASKASSTMTIIEEGAHPRINILNFQCSISLTRQIPFFVGIISFDICSWFNTTLLPTCQGRPNLLKSIIYLYQDRFV